MSDQMSVQISDDLFRAAFVGDEQTLRQWLTTPPDASLLGNILRASALLGHVPIIKLLLEHDHNLAVRTDSCGRTALHLASLEGNLEIVKTLLVFNNGNNNDLCLYRDKEGKIPLHYAAMRGRTKVVQELIQASPESVCPGDQDKTTVFHLCVTYNHFETLETLVKLDSAKASITAGEPRPVIFTRRDWAGDTIFHLAVTLKRVEVVSYLLSVPEIRKVVANLKNEMGSTQNIMDQDPKDNKTCEIQHMLIKAQNEKVLKVDHPWKNILMKILRGIGEWSSRHEDEYWTQDMKENLSLVSTVIATITFQAMINPPGGFIQQGLVSKENTTSSIQVPNNVTSSYDLLSCGRLHDNNTYCPGQAMASSPHLHEDYKDYLLFVSVSFFSSLSVTLMLVSGIFPMKNKLVVWMLSIGMWISLSFLAAAYATAISIIVPRQFKDQKGLLSTILDVAIDMIWVRLLGLIVVLITLRLSIRMLKIIINKWRKNGSLRFLSVLFMIFIVVIFSVPSALLFFYLVYNTWIQFKLT